MHRLRSISRRISRARTDRGGAGARWQKTTLLERTMYGGVRNDNGNRQSGISISISVFNGPVAIHASHPSPSVEASVWTSCLGVQTLLESGEPPAELARSPYAARNTNRPSSGGWRSRRAGPHISSVRAGPLRRCGEHSATSPRLSTTSMVSPIRTPARGDLDSGSGKHDGKRFGTPRSTDGARRSRPSLP